MSFSLTHHQDEDINQVFDDIHKTQDPQYSRLSQFFEDPRKTKDNTKEGRIPLVLLIDSTKIEVFFYCLYELGLPSRGLFFSLGS